MTMSPFRSVKRFWQYYASEPIIHKNGVAVFKMDAKNSKVNTLSPALQDETKQLWNEFIKPRKSEIKSVVFMSAKSDNFIAGADISMLAHHKKNNTEDDLKDLCMSGHELFEELKSYNIPIVAAIHGSCLGGGLEWALKCDYRIATTSSVTKLGLPEIKLGLLPGWGGTYALPKTIGIAEALPMLLQGKEINAFKAKKIGLIDDICDQYSLETIAIDTAHDLAFHKVKNQPKKNWFHTFSESSIGRNYILNKAKQTIDKTTKGKYPAPYEIIQCVNNTYTLDQKQAFIQEATSFTKLAKTSESSALIGLFEGTTHTRKNKYTKHEKPVSNVTVIGAGLMGAGIAQVSAEKGMNVVLKDTRSEGIAKGLDYISTNLHKKVHRRRMTNYKCNHTLSNVYSYVNDTDNAWLRNLNKTDIVIEAVFEDLDLKRNIFQSIENHVKDSCVLATNTSAIPIKNIASVCEHPERVLGMHYFSPVPQMQVLEIIPHTHTSQEALSRAFETGIKQGKYCIEVSDVPGFYVNRCLAPMMAEMIPLFKDGVSPQDLDKAIKDLGMPVGPITLIDEVGIDVAMHVQNTMCADTTMGNRMTGSDAAILQTMIDKGWLGRKSGKGFFIYNGKNKTPNQDAMDFIKNEVKKKDSNLDTKTIQNRYLSRFVNEAVYCLQEKIIKSPIDGDIGAVFGIGFPPFLGGPFRMIDMYGINAYVNHLNKLADDYGEHFRPCELLVKYSKNSQTFY